MGKIRGGKSWRERQRSDPYVRRAQEEGWRSRAVFKLAEIDRREHLLRKGMLVVDLGAAPGGWSQYAARRVGAAGTVIALDLLPMEPIDGVGILTGDFREEECLKALRARIGGRPVDLVISDMAPNISGIAGVDQARAALLAELALELAGEVLKPGGDLVMKLFHGEGFDAIVAAARRSFAKLKVRKPQASRPSSRETYLLARNYKV